MGYPVTASKVYFHHHTKIFGVVVCACLVLMAFVSCGLCSNRVQALPSIIMRTSSNLFRSAAGLTSISMKKLSSPFSMRVTSPITIPFGNMPLSPDEINTSPICMSSPRAGGDDIQIGDVLISSGLSGIFPKGMVIGEVTRIEKGEDSFFMDIEVKPAADLKRLEEVIIIMEGNA